MRDHRQNQSIKDAITRQSGHFALEGGTGQVEFRNIRIRELSMAASAQPSQADNSAVNNTSLKQDLEIIYEEDFRNPGEKSLGNYDNENAHRGYRDGFYELSLERGSAPWVGFELPLSVVDFELEMRLRLTGVANSSRVSIGFRDNNESNKKKCSGGMYIIIGQY